MSSTFDRWGDPGAPADPAPSFIGDVSPTELLAWAHAYQEGLDTQADINWLKENLDHHDEGTSSDADYDLGVIKIQTHHELTLIARIVAETPERSLVNTTALDRFYFLGGRWLGQDPAIERRLVELDQAPSKRPEEVAATGIRSSGYAPLNSMQFERSRMTLLGGLSTQVQRELDLRHMAPPAVGFRPTTDSTCGNAFGTMCLAAAGIRESRGQPLPRVAASRIRTSIPTEIYRRHRGKRPPAGLLRVSNRIDGRRTDKTVPVSSGHI